MRGRNRIKVRPVTDEPKVLQVLVRAEDRQLLIELETATDLRVGEVSEETSAADLHFDLGGAAESAYAVTAVVSGFGGTATVVNWAVTRLKRQKKTIEIRAGGTTVRIEPGQDASEVRALIEDALAGRTS